MSTYDSWLLQQAEEYMSNAFCDGEPEVIDSYQEYDGKDENGNIETSTVYVYNCEDCDNEDCEYWKDFN